MLGAQLGTNLDKETLWSHLKPKLLSLLESKLNHCGDELGDTLIANSIITGSIIFNTRLQYISTKNIKLISKWSLFFVRAKSYLLSTLVYTTVVDNFLQNGF